MTDLLPLFPLPNVVLFPGVFLPLHVFEPRYREMVADALQGDRLIGMTLLQPGWQADYEGRPPVYPIGCSGVITHVELLPDGRYNLVLRGLDRFRIVSEDHARSYRRAEVDLLRDPPLDQAGRRQLYQCRQRLESLVDTKGSRKASYRHPGMTDTDYVHAVAQYLELEPIEKQALLAIDTITCRAESLVDLAEMRRWMARAPHGGSRLAH